MTTFLSCVSDCNPIHSVGKFAGHIFELTVPSPTQLQLTWHTCTLTFVVGSDECVPRAGLGSLAGQSHCLYSMGQGLARG